MPWLTVTRVYPVLVFALVILNSGLTYAIDCPPAPKQADSDLIVDAKGAIGALLGLRAGELEGHVEKKTYDLFSKYSRQL